MLKDRLLKLLHATTLDGVELPKGVGVLDPLRGEHASTVQRVVGAFHEKFYPDDNARTLMLGINPGRLGAGSTGLPFTDTKRCESELGIPVPEFRTHEPSSDFVYRMINAAGGPKWFYDRFYIHSVCPLGFVQRSERGNEVNLNYYDRKDLEQALGPFMVRWMRNLIATGMRNDVVFCIGTGKNMKAFERINARAQLFKEIIPLPHPRYIMQYKAKQIGRYVDTYLRELNDRSN